MVVTGDPGHVGDTDGFKGSINCGVEGGGGYKQQNFNSIDQLITFEWMNLLINKFSYDVAILTNLFTLFFMVKRYIT